MPKKKNPDDEFLTRGVFKEELKREFAAFAKEMRQENQRLLINIYNTLIEPRFSKLENEVSDFRQESFGRFDDLYKKFEDLNQEYVFTNHQLKGIDLRMDRLESKVDGLERKVDILETRLPYPS